MNYGERLHKARLHAHLSQAQLAERSGVTQSTVSQLENSSTDNGSAHTVRFARACGISPDWLDDEVGDMLPSGLTISEPRVAAIAATLLRAMEDGQDYLVERTQKDLAADIELIAQATAHAKANDC